MNRASNSLLFVLLTCSFLCIVGCTNQKTNDKTTVSPGAVSASAATQDPVLTDAIEETDSLLPEDLSTIQDNSNTVPVDTIPGSITCLVNRQFPLPANYIPKDLVEPKVSFSFSYQSDKRKMRKPAAKALEKMFQAAKKDKIILYGVSAYRSYQRQKQIYQRNVSLYGADSTDTFSAKPGSSEHQSGLTIDISAACVDNALSQAFGNTKEGMWVAKNAHKYGYIIRFPKGKSAITGYHYEPWHIRYVGVTTATYLYKHKLTLEEYYGVQCDKVKQKPSVDVEDPDHLDYDEKSDE